jgi:ankyrin repeat protein
MNFFDLLKAGNLESVKEQAEADPYVLSNTNDKGFTPLIMACYNQQYNIASYLLEASADVNAKDSAGNSALIGVGFKGFTDIANLLIELGADVNATNSNNATALIYAAMFNQKEIAKLLLENGADKSINDSSGNSAFDHATGKGFIAMADIVK